MASNPVVILTGASKGIGLAICEILLRANVNVIAMSRSETPEITSLASKYPGALVISQGNVAEDLHNKAAVDLALQSFGRLDSVVLNAGTLVPLGTTASFTGRIEEVKSLFDINYFSLVSMLTYAIPHLKSSEGKTGLDGVTAGRIVLVSSGAATGGVAGWGAYSASKAAMNSLARTLGNEEPSIVTVSVRPGTVSTDMQLAIRETGKSHMLEADYVKFSALHTDGVLLPPHKPGGILAGLALKAEAKLSGSFLSHDEASLEHYRLN